MNSHEFSSVLIQPCSDTTIPECTFCLSKSSMSAMINTAQMSVKMILLASLAFGMIIWKDDLDTTKQKKSRKVQTSTFFVSYDNVLNEQISMDNHLADQCLNNSSVSKYC